MSRAAPALEHGSLVGTGPWPISQGWRTHIHMYIHVPCTSTHLPSSESSDSLPEEIRDMYQVRT